MSSTATITRDRVTDAAKAVAWLLEVPSDTLAETVSAAMADRYAATQRVYMPGVMAPAWKRLSPELRQSMIRHWVNLVAGCLAIDSAISPVLFPFASDEDADEKAVPLADTIVQAAYLFATHRWTHVPNRRALREFRAVVAAAIRFGFQDDEE